VAELSEELTFDIGPGLAQAEVLASAFDTIAQSFGSALSDAITSAFASLDTSVLSNLTLGADGSAVTAEGEAAVQAIDPTIVLQADTADLIAQGDAAIPKMGRLTSFGFAGQMLWKKQAIDPAIPTMRHGRAT